MSPEPPIFRRAAEGRFLPTRRPGLRERRLLGPADSPHQNLVMVEADEGAEVELHPVPNSESFVVLEGELLVHGDGYRERLGPGDVCHFPPGHSHGVRVTAAPARFLVVFAPARPAGG